MVTNGASEFDCGGPSGGRTARWARPRRALRPGAGMGRVLGLLTAFVAVGCAGDGEGSRQAEGAPGSGAETGPATALVAFTGATLWDGTGADPVSDAVLLVRDGRVEAVGSRDGVEIPGEARVEELGGAFLIPGLINAHGHVGGVEGLRSSSDLYTRENILDQLRLYAHYGITTVVSLGGDGPEGARIRDEQETAGLDRARLFIAGPVLTPSTPGEADGAVAGLEPLSPEWVKIRVDDNLGQGQAMSRETYAAVIRAAAERGLPLAAHIVRAEDARGVVEEGARVVAHSVRDEVVDDDLLALFLAEGICYTPTFTREVSVFAYQDRPDFFDDPFFLKTADPDVLQALEDPDRQAAVRASASAQWYEAQLPVAMENLRLISEAGVPIAMGTDSGPPARFQGYFEHLEMEMMVEAGLSPERVLRSATAEAASCMGLSGVGVLEPGAWADFLVVRADPRADIRNLREIQGVWIAGNRFR